MLSVRKILAEVRAGPCACAACRAELVVRRLFGLTAAALILAALVFGCAGPSPARRIAGDLGRQLDQAAEWPLPVRCQLIRDAERRCELAGLDARCFADGWVDQDRDPWTVAACRTRRADP